MKPHYTIAVVKQLTPKFRDMISQLSAFMLAHPIDNFEKRELKFNINGHDFIWSLSISGARVLLKAKSMAGFEQIKDIPASEIPALSATISVNNKHYVLSTTEEDHQHPIDALGGEIIDKLTDQFTHFVITRIVDHWYNTQGMRDRLHGRADVSDWLYINEHCEGCISGFYDNKGYSVITEIDGKSVAEDTHYDQDGVENPKNTNRAIYKRYLDLHVAKLLVSQVIFKDKISAPLI